jgi:hypothetical protein
MEFSSIIGILSPYKTNNIDINSSHLLLSLDFVVVVVVVAKRT